MNEIPDRLICQATLDGCSVAGVMIRAGFGVVAKNAYAFIFGPTNHDGCVVITRDEVIKRADEELNGAIMDYVPLKGGFSGDISLRAIGPEEIQQALKGYKIYHAFSWFPSRYKKELEAALARPESKRASDIKVTCLK
jgi:hypothetical protein